MKRLLCLASLIIAVSFVPGASIAGTIINKVEVENYLAVNGNFSQAGFTGTTFDTHHLLDVSRGNYYSQAQVDFTQSVGGETLSFDIFQNRDGGNKFDYSHAYQRIKFVVDTDTTYHLSGYFYSTDIASPGQHLLDIELRGRGVGLLYKSWQESVATSNESFILGGTRGDLNSSVRGNPSGTLLAGTEYTLYGSFITESVAGTDQGASARGNVTLTIGSGATVTVAAAVAPEPSSIVLWSIGLLTMTALRRRQR